MRRIPWDIILALFIGLGMGLVYAWMISPRTVTDAAPVALRADFKDHYRAAIAAAYAATSNLPRAQARLDLLKDPDPIEALNAQAQRMLAQGEPSRRTDQVAALALALSTEEVVLSSSTVTEIAIAANSTSTDPTSSSDSPVIPADTPPTSSEASASSATPVLAVQDTQPATPTSMPRPTRTAVPTQAVPFKLTGQDEICDPNLPDGLLQVIVVNSNRRQIPGMSIAITWDGGAEQFFTGLKPELGNGYADFTMTPNLSYTVQLAAGSDIATGLTPPTCQAVGGENFFGGIKLTFQQP